MKKSIILLGCAALLMAGCNKVETVEEPEAQEPSKHLNVDIAVNYGEGTRAVKTGWAAGDKIYVVFDVTFLENDGYYMTLTYNGSSWMSEFSDPELETKLMAQETGKLGAAYIASDADPVFEYEYDAVSNPYMRYLTMTNTDQLKSFFLGAEVVDYEVAQGTLTAELNMILVPSTLHFYLWGISKEDAGNYTLSCSRLQSTHFKSFNYLYYDFTSYVLEGGPWVDYTLGGYGKPIPGSSYGDGLEFVAYLDPSALQQELEYVFYVVDNNGTASNTADDTIYSMTKTVTFNGKEAIWLPNLSNDQAWTVLSPSDLSPDFNAFNEEVSW